MKSAMRQKFAGNGICPAEFAESTAEVLPGRRSVRWKRRDERRGTGFSTKWRRNFCRKVFRRSAFASPWLTTQTISAKPCCSASCEAPESEDWRESLPPDEMKRDMPSSGRCFPLPERKLKTMQRSTRCAPTTTKATIAWSTPGTEFAGS